MPKFYVSVAMLVGRQACEDQVDLFRETFGTKRVPLTEAVVRKALNAGLDVRWPALRLSYYGTRERLSAKLSNEARAAYDRLLDIESEEASDSNVAEATQLLTRVAEIWQHVKRKEAR